MSESNPLEKNFNVITLIQFAFPSILMMLFMGLYTIVDTIFVARFVNTNALSAINIVCPIVNLIVGLGTMLATGSSAVIATKMGKGKIEEARSDFTFIIIIVGSIIGLIITVIGLVWIDKIILGLGASDVLFSYCKEYLTIQFLFTIGNMMQVLYQNLFVTAGRPSLGLILSIVAGSANIVFDYIFIVMCQMGIKGAALGTGIGYMIPVVIGTLFFLIKKNELHFCKPKIDFSVLLKSCSNGASEMVSQLSTAITTFMFNSTMLNLTGEDGVAAITVIIYSGFLLTTLYIGFSMGVAPIISYNYGSQNTKRLKKVIYICFYFIIISSLFIFLFSFFGGEYLTKLFVGNNKTVFEIAKVGFMIYSFSFLFSGCNIFASTLFTALSNGKVSALISFLRTFGLIMVLLLILPKFLQVIGVWLAVPIAELFTLIITIFLIYHNQSKYHYL